MGTRIAVVGSLNMDLVVRVPHMPIPGETVIGSDFRTILGGKGANQAVAAARLGAEVTLIGRVGDDDFGRAQLRNLGESGINTAHVTVDQEAATGIALDKVSRLGFVSLREAARLAQEYVSHLAIRTPGLQQKVKNLSGGNQQKVVLARWLSLNPKVLILDEPTRGIDVGAKAEIHALMSQLAKQGVGIIMISSELPEVLGISDRILVMHEGRIVAGFRRGEASQDEIMLYATGGERNNDRQKA